MKIVKGQYTPVSAKYTTGLREMVNKLLLKNQRNRPSIQEILEMSEMKKRMELYGYKTEDHLLSQTQVNSGNLFNKAYREEQKSHSSEPRVGKQIENKLVPDIDKLRQDLAAKNKGAPKVPGVSPAPTGAANGPAKRPASESGQGAGQPGNRAEINYDKYRQLLKMPHAAPPGAPGAGYNFKSPPILLNNDNNARPAVSAQKPRMENVINQPQKYKEQDKIRLSRAMEYAE